jgi:hypothetical protein
VPAVPSADEARALARTHEWFAGNSGWAPPDPDTLAEWLADGVCRSPDGCLVVPGRWCAHGLAAWDLVLRYVDDR